MRKTIRKVMIVVPVLIINCQVSEKPKIGPVNPQARIMVRAAIKAHPDPAILEILAANFRKYLFILTPPEFELVPL
jgi:hypothetical protein